MRTHNNSDKVRASATASINREYISKRINVCRGRNSGETLCHKGNWDQHIMSKLEGLSQSACYLNSFWPGFKIRDEWFYVCVCVSPEYATCIAFLSGSTLWLIVVCLRRRQSSWVGAGRRPESLILGSPRNASSLPQTLKQHFSHQTLTFALPCVSLISFPPKNSEGYFMHA